MVKLSDSIKTYPDLSFAAIRLRKHRQLRLWYLLYDLDKQGGGRIEKKEAYAALKDVMSYEVFRTTLLSGTGDFWEIRTRHPKRGGGVLIELRGLANVAWALSVDKLRKSPALVPLKAFSKMSEFRAFIYATWFNNEESNPISRKTLRQLAGISAPTQVEYDKKTSTSVTKNVCVIGPKKGVVPTDMQEGGYYITEVKGQLQLCKRLPNSYFCDLPSASRGRIRKANYLLSARRRVGRDNVFERRYFQDPRSWGKSRKSRANLSYVYAGDFGATRLWEEICLDPIF